METRANYILIGAFTLLGALGLVVFFFAFARIEFDQRLAYYEARFSTVAGLGQASDVRFAGLAVGQVVDVRLAPERDGTVIVRVEVEANTPVRADSLATIEAQGVTGVAFVSLSAGTPDTELLDGTGGNVPEIGTGRSVIQSLSEDAPELVTSTLDLVRDLGDLFNGENRDRIERIIVNTETASDAFASTLEDFANVAGSVDGFVEQIDRFNSVLQTLVADLDTALITADATLEAWGTVAEDTSGLIATADDALGAAGSSFATTETYITEGLGPTTQELQATLAELRAEIGTLGDETEDLIATYTETGTLANARLTELAATLSAVDDLIANTDVAMSSVETAATDFGTLVVEDGAQLLDETRAMIASADAAVLAIRQTTQDDLPGILADVEAAAGTIAEVSASVGDNLVSATGGLDQLITEVEATMASATGTFANANDTLAAINAALATGEATLEAAEGAFVSAETVLTEEIGTLVARFDETLDGLDTAIGQVSADLPGISQNVSQASAAAEAAFASLATTVRNASPSVQEFAATGLPQYSQLAREMRELAQNLDRLVRQINRDPARFFVGGDAPEFRR